MKSVCRLNADSSYWCTITLCLSSWSYFEPSLNEFWAKSLMEFKSQIMLCIITLIFQHLFDFWNKGYLFTLLIHILLFSTLLPVQQARNDGMICIYSARYFRVLLAFSRYHIIISHLLVSFIWSCSAWSYEWWFFKFWLFRCFFWYLKQDPHITSNFP